MISIDYSDRETEAKGLGYLAGCFSFKAFDTGVTLVPAAAAGPPADQGLRIYRQWPGDPS